MPTFPNRTVTTSSPLTIVAAVNDEKVFSENLLASPDVRTGRAQVTAIRSASSAGEAYNCGLMSTTGRWIVFSHQDVFLPEGWVDRLSDEITSLERVDPNWGVVGVWGRTEAGNWGGNVYCNGAGRLHRGSEPLPCRVSSLDELLLVVRRESGLRFDGNLPGFHLYGTDIILEGMDLGMSSFAVDAPVVHNSETWRQLGRSYRIAYSYMRRKWRPQLPLRTCIVDIGKTSFPVWHRAIRIAIATARGKKKNIPRNPLPMNLAALLDAGPPTIS